jgi:hypothetical protein
MFRLIRLGGQVLFALIVIMLYLLVLSRGQLLSGGLL